MAGGGRFELVVDPGARAPGEALVGRLRVSEGGEVRDLEAELGRLERSSGNLPPAFQSLVRTKLADASVGAGDELPFSLTVPSDAMPGFTAPHGSVEWALRVHGGGFGRRVEAEHLIEVSAGGPPLSAAKVAALGSVAAEKATADRPDNKRLGWIFVAIGAVFLVLGAFWVASPPASWEENGSGGGALAFSFGLGVLLAGCGALVLRAEVVKPIGPVSITLDAASVRPGEPLRCVVTNEASRPLAIGLESVENVQRRTQTGTSAHVVTHRDHVLHADWRPLAEGASTVEFTVPSAALATYAGERITIAHRISVVPAGKERSKRNRSQLHTPVVVVR